MATKRKCSGTIKKMPSLLSSRDANVAVKLDIFFSGTNCESGFNRVRQDEFPFFSPQSM